jgi:hypothetical protein
MATEVYVMRTRKEQGLQTQSELAKDSEMHMAHGCGEDQFLLLRRQAVSSSSDTGDVQVL